MSRITPEIRMTIAQNIRACRLKKYPGRGGSKRCVEAFSQHIGHPIAQQQWSPWERGMRTPDAQRLQQIARFFGKTVEYMYQDHHSPVPGAPSLTHLPPAPPPYDQLPFPELLHSMCRNKVKAIYQVEVTVSSVSYITDPALYGSQQ